MVLSLSQISEWSNENQYTAPRLVGEHPRVIIIGETYQNKAQIASQTKLIDLVKPKVILHEMAGGARCTYTPEEGGQFIYNVVAGSGYNPQDITSGLSGLYDYMKDWVRTKELEIVGIDLKTRALNKKANEKYPGREFKQDELMPSSKLMCEIREEWMGQLIVSHWPDKNEQLMIIAGSEHTQENSAIYRLLKRDNPKLAQKLNQNPEYGYVYLNPK